MKPSSSWTVSNSPLPPPSPINSDGAWFHLATLEAASARQIRDIQVEYDLSQFLLFRYEMPPPPTFSLRASASVVCFCLAVDGGEGDGVSAGSAASVASASVASASVASASAGAPAATAAPAPCCRVLLRVVACCCVLLASLQRFLFLSDEEICLSLQWVRDHRPFRCAAFKPRFIIGC